MIKVLEYNKQIEDNLLVHRKELYLFGKILILSHDRILGADGELATVFQKY